MKMQADRNNIKTPLFTMLLVDRMHVVLRTLEFTPRFALNIGSTYFAALLALNSLSIAGWVTNLITNTATLFVVPLLAIIVSRFLLNLRQAAYSGSHDDTHVRSATSAHSQNGLPARTNPSIEFASFVGNMGESTTDGSDSFRDPDLKWMIQDSDGARDQEADMALMVDDQHDLQEPSTHGRQSGVCEDIEL
ncbi:hypothetical protein OBBRIDRAFT_884721 [Obba rivulosa]|uniref:Uncharacterized protein n=1 Tax=Obba rivulosa TaxID=1052685 RepID=A0A8E2DRT4_9APHY|nr:hypothetical protein OBBRIDRAFT_884721 [Obba rivulosa]